MKDKHKLIIFLTRDIQPKFLILIMNGNILVHKKLIYRFKRIVKEKHIFNALEWFLFSCVFITFASTRQHTCPFLFTSLSRVAYSSSFARVCSYFPFIIVDMMLRYHLPYKTTQFALSQFMETQQKWLLQVLKDFLC